MTSLQGTFFSSPSTPHLSTNPYSNFMPAASPQTVIFLPTAFSLGVSYSPSALIHSVTSLPKLPTSFSVTPELWLHVSQCLVDFTWMSNTAFKMPSVKLTWSSYFLALKLPFLLPWMVPFAQTLGPATLKVWLFVASHIQLIAESYWPGHRNVSWLFLLFISDSSYNFNSVHCLSLLIVFTCCCQKNHLKWILLLCAIPLFKNVNGPLVSSIHFP